MEEAEQSLKSKEDRLKKGTDPPDGAVRKVSTVIRNGDGNMMEEVKNYGAGNNSSEELKAVGLGDLKDGEDVKNLKEVRDMEERNIVKQMKDGEEDKDTGVTKVVVETEAREAMDGEGKEAGDSHDMEEKKNLEKTKDEEKKKELEIQNGNEMKFVVDGKDREVNRVLERVDDARDSKSVEDVKYNNQKYGFGDVEAIGGKRKEEGSNPIDDISVKEPKNGKNEESMEEMKDDEHSKYTNGEKDEDNVLVQVEENAKGKARKEAKDMELVGTKDVVEKEALDVKNEGKLVVREGEEVGKDNDGSANKTMGDNEKTKSWKRKRSRVRRPSKTSEAKKNGVTKENVEEMEVKASRKSSKEVMGSPVVSSSDRPVRERKIVERLVEVIEKGPDSTVIIEKGRGTPLREIPNVAYNLARKKPAELKLLHQILFGRKGKAVDFKSNLLQFSGFAWHESEEKQRAKTKEKLDKCVKETLLELCDLFDLTVSKSNTKKDELIVKVFDFLEAPRAMSHVMHAEKKPSKSRKRERSLKADASKSSKSSGGNFEKRFRRHDKSEGAPNSDVKSSHDTEEEDDEDEVGSHSESDAEEEELEERGDGEEEEDDESEDDAESRREGKQASSEAVKGKIGRSSKKSSPKTDGKGSLRTPPAKHSKAEGIDDTVGVEEAESPKRSNSKSKEKSYTGKASKGKPKAIKEQKSGPTKAQLRQSILEILKEVDFNTATFTDILQQLASKYKIDLTTRKASIKLMTQEELSKMADEEEESQDDDDEELQ